MAVLGGGWVVLGGSRFFNFQQWKDNMHELLDYMG